MTDTSHDEAVIVFKYYSSAAEISSSELSTQVESSQLKDHIANQIVIRLISLLADTDSEDDKEKSTAIDSIETINAAFTDKAVNLKLSSMNLIKHIKLICQLT